jgi:hypothetical protein
LLHESPRNDQREIIPHDHSGIKNDDGIIRRVSREYVVDDPKSGGKKSSTMAVRPSSEPNGGMSVDLLCAIEQAGLIARDYVVSPRWIGAIRFEAGQLRTEEFKVGFHPLPDQPYHGEVWGKFTHSKQKKLLNLAQWFVTINDVALYSE